MKFVPEISSLHPPTTIASVPVHEEAGVERQTCTCESVIPPAVVVILSVPEVCAGATKENQTSLFNTPGEVKPGPSIQQLPAGIAGEPVVVAPTLVPVAGVPRVRAVALQIKLFAGCAASFGAAKAKIISAIAPKGVKIFLML